MDALAVCRINTKHSEQIVDKWCLTLPDHGDGVPEEGDHGAVEHLAEVVVRVALPHQLLPRLQLLQFLVQDTQVVRAQDLQRLAVEEHTKRAPCLDPTTTNVQFRPHYNEQNISV